MSNGRPWMALGLAGVLLADACGGNAPPTPTLVPGTATAGVTARPSASAPVPSPLTSAVTTPTLVLKPTAGVTASATVPGSSSPRPISDATPWAAEICDINADFIAASQSITADIPEPASRTLAAVKLMHEQRRPRIEALNADALARTAAVNRIEGGDTFQDALAAEFTNQQVTTAAFYRAVAAATSLADIDAAQRIQGENNVSSLAESSRAVTQMPLPLADGIAATGGCRFFEFDARARLRGAVTGTFTKTVIQDDFSARGPWKLGDFDGGSSTLAGGKLSIHFTDGGGIHAITATEGPPQTAFGDVRVEAAFSVEPYSLSGLTCRSTGGAFYTVQVSPSGLVLVYRWAPQQRIIGRRTSPKGAVEAKLIQLAIECAGGRDGQPLVIAVYLDGERVAEVVDDRPLAAQGLAGMFAQAVGAATTTSFEDVRILVPGE